MNTRDLAYARELAGAALLLAARDGRLDYRRLVADVRADHDRDAPRDVQRAAESDVKNVIERELADHIRTHREQ